MLSKSLNRFKKGIAIPFILQKHSTLFKAQNVPVEDRRERLYGSIHPADISPPHFLKIDVFSIQ